MKAPLTVGHPDTYTPDGKLDAISGPAYLQRKRDSRMIASRESFVNVPRLTQHSFTVDPLNSQLLHFGLLAGCDQPPDRYSLYWQ